MLFDRFIRLVAVLTIAGLVGCASRTVRIPTPTTETTTMRAGPDTRGAIGFRGTEVETVGQDTIVTQFLVDSVRRFVLKGLIGYSGEIGRDFVNLTFEDVSVWIDRESIKVHTPDADFDVPIGLDNPEAAGHGDFVIEREAVRPIPVSTR